MSGSSKTTYFILGGNRGIGYNLVQILSASTNNFVITSARGSLSLPKNKELDDLRKIRNNIHIVQLDVTEDESIDNIADEIKKAPSFQGIDVFIASSAISNSYNEVLKTLKSVWLEHYTTNALGPILVLQKVYPLLLLKKTRKVFFISSEAGSITGYIPISVSAYGQSKAALNYAIKALSFELKPEGFTVVAFHPGVVSTDMGKYGIDQFTKRHKNANLIEVMTPKESASALVGIFSKILPEDNGKFFNYDGSERAF
ncbi:YKL071W [Saccharomyces arboricola H-6]|uniref:YKL071W n=1 Tax=Saccharomyces arboricola (strain H-6 / AS 2.3317 / CBS 10644) TaxID=1160507 RepID=J8PRQ8_SACAR|nr:YKL071W [Saccharomyces arboricola H-6]